jgi:hypothetical protein
MKQQRRGFASFELLFVLFGISLGFALCFPLLLFFKRHHPSAETWCLLGVPALLAIVLFK